MGKRGRKPGSTTVNLEQKERPRKYKVEHLDKRTGITSIWTYNLDLSPNGPISTEFKYPSDYKSDAEIEDKLPKSQRKYLNPANGKYVGYSRAVQLGLKIG